MVSTPDPSPSLQLRKLLGTPQHELARWLGVHPITVSCWERGTRKPLPYNVQQVDLALKGARTVPVDQRTALRYTLATLPGPLALARLIALGDSSLP